MRLSAGKQEKRWIIRPIDSRCTNFAKKLKVSPLLAQVLINRGVTSAEAAALFLKPALTNLISPEQMPQVQPAVHRITQAVKNKEKITVYGDYDVDGIAGVAIVLTILRLLGANADYYIPHRTEEGYGLNADAVRLLASSATKLLITVDCGINAISTARLAKQLGLEFIITDHHRPGNELPQAVAIVHPAMEKSYPNQDSSGALVAFKLAWALANEFAPGRKLDPPLRQFMINATTLAAIGTVADIVDLRGENRIITSYGLKALPQSTLCGLQALIDSAGLTSQQLDTFHVGFRLAPMLNAAGRMGHARRAVELLTSDSPTQAAQIAQYLKEQNDLRRRCERKIFSQACELIERQGLDSTNTKTIVLHRDDWHTGVIGIVASRIVDKYFRPTIMIGAPLGEPANNTQNTGPIDDTASVAHGSARSIPDFDICAAIEACSHHLCDFGGHKMAAGITIRTKNITKFAAEFENYAKKNLAEDSRTAKLHIDAEVPLTGFNKDTVRELKLLEPFGQGNPKPVFATKGVRLANVPRKVGAGGEHLQLAITDNTSSIRCVGFRFGKLQNKLLENEFFNVAYEPQINVYNGAGSVQLVIADIQFD